MLETSPKDCIICARQKQANNRVVYEDAHWIVRHSTETNILGYYWVESRRHILDLSEMNAEECASYGLLLKNLMEAMRSVVECKRIYSFALSETVPHFHLHVIPRRPDFPKAYSGRGIMQYPLTPTADPALVDEVCDRTRRALARNLHGAELLSSCR